MRARGPKISGSGSCIADCKHGPRHYGEGQCLSSFFPLICVCVGVLRQGFISFLISKSLNTNCHRQFRWEVLHEECMDTSDDLTISLFFFQQQDFLSSFFLVLKQNKDVIQWASYVLNRLFFGRFIYYST